MADLWLTLEDFLQSWVTPADALASFDRTGVQMGMERLVRKLHLGIGGLAVCEHAVRLYPSPRQDFPLCNVHAGVFVGGNIPEKFWITGDLEVMLEIKNPAPAIPGETGLQAALRTAATDYQRWAYVGVRFPPSLIQSILPTNQALVITKLEAQADEAGERAQSSPPRVSQQELRNWARDFLAGKPAGLLFSQIENAARSHFVGQKITRDPLRTAIKSANYPMNRGNPSIRGNSARE